MASQDNDNRGMKRKSSLEKLDEEHIARQEKNYHDAQNRFSSLSVHSGAMDIAQPKFRTLEETMDMACRNLEAREREALEKKRAEKRRQDQPVPRSHQEMPDPEGLEYRDLPETLKQIPVAIRIDKGGDALGSVRSLDKSGGFGIAMHWDFGRKSNPALSLTVFRLKNMKSETPLSKATAAERYSIRCLWYPGVEHETADGESKYEIETLDAESGPEAATGLGLTPQEMNRLVSVNFKGNSAQMEFVGGNNQMASTMKNQSDKRWANLIDHLTRNESMELTILFLVPERLGLDAESYLSQTMICWDFVMENRWKPFHAYYSEDKINVHPEMCDVWDIGNRMLGVYRPENGPMFTEVDGKKVYRMPDSISTFGSRAVRTLDQFAIAHMTSAVRQYQYENGELGALSADHLPFSVFKTGRGVGAGGKKSSNPQQKAQESTYYAILHYSDATKGRIPPEGSCWTISWKQIDQTGREIPVEQEQKWTAVVRDFRDDEREITGGAALFVCTRPYKGQKVKAEDQFSKCGDTPTYLGLIELEPNPVPLNRQLEAIKMFADPNRKDLDIFRNPLVFSTEQHVGKPIPVVELNAYDANGRADTMKTAEFSEAWSHALRLIDHQLNDSQRVLLKEVLPNLKRRTHGIFGGFGCKKTSTMALATVLLVIVGHKVLVVAAENNALDWFITKLEQYRTSLLDLAMKADTNFEVPDFADDLANQQYLRFLPPAIDHAAARQGLCSEFDDATPDEQVTLSRQDKKAYLKDTKLVGLLAAIEAEETAAKKHTSVLLAADLDAVEKERIKATSKKSIEFIDELAARARRIRADYERIQASDREFTFPARNSMTYLMNQLRKRVLTDTDRAVLKKYDDALSLVQKLGDQSKPKERRTAIKALAESQDDLSHLVLKSVDVVVTTYVNSLQDNIRRSFYPTLVIDEEASRTPLRLSVMTCAFPSIQVRLCTGDPNQLQPLVKTKQLDEFTEFASTSLLDTLIKKGLGVSWLTEQNRCHPSLSTFPNRKFYDGKLTDATNMKNDNGIRACFRDFAKVRLNKDLSAGPKRKETEQFLAVDVMFSVATLKEGTSSLENWGSAESLVRFLRELQKHRITYNGTEVMILPEHVTILTFYKEQCSRIKYFMRKYDVRAKDVITVDAAQGIDNKITLLDPTATGHGRQLANVVNGDGDSTEGVHMRLSEHVKSRFRWNAFLTRCIDACVVFANFTSFSNAVKNAPKHDKTIHVIQSLLQEIHDRDVLVTDDIEDQNPVVQNPASEKARKAYEDLKRDAQDRLKWFSTYRDNTRHQRQYLPADRKEPGTVRFSGPGFAGPFGLFPTEFRKDVETRAETGTIAKPDPNAFAPTDDPKTAAKKAKKSRNNKARAERDAAKDAN